MAWGGLKYTRSSFLCLCNNVDSVMALFSFLYPLPLCHVPFSAFTTVLQVSSLKAISLSIICILTSLSSHIFLLTIYMLVIPKLCEVSALAFPPLSESLPRKSCLSQKS